MSRLRNDENRKADRKMNKAEGSRMVKQMVLAAFAAIFLTLGLTASAQATVPGKNGLITFSSTRDGNAEIYTTTRTGVTVQRLTNAAADDTHPAFSPNGARIAFVSDRDGGDKEIYVMNADGSDQTRITNHVGDDMDPAWSPDGTRLAIRRDIGSNNEIFLIDAVDGANPVNLTNGVASEFEPEFSPDATKIVFQRYTSGTGVGLGNEVMLMDADGSNQINLTNNANTNNDGRPSFAPGGNRIAFDSNRNDSRFEIYTMASDGSDVIRLTNSAEVKKNPSFSPAGDLVAFDANAAGIGLVPASGGSTTAATSDPDSNPAWSTDSNRPTTNISAGPADGSTVNSRTAEFTFAANEPESTFECRLDSTEAADWTSCTSPKQYTGLIDASHTFEVRATDLGGNVEVLPDHRTWAVDATAPVVTIDSGPQGTVNSKDANIAFSVDDSAATVECRLDSADDNDWAACASPKELTGLAEGDHTLEVRATDTAANVSTVVSRNWTVNTTAPITTIDSAPAADVDGKVHSIRATFEFSANDPNATFECRLDSTEAADWAACSSPKSYNQLADGPHGFEVRATDAVANVGIPDSHAWEVLTAKPNATITAGPTGLVNSAEASFGFNSDLGSATFECRVDSSDAGDWAACDSPKELTGLTDGEHTFELRATDLDQGTGPVVSRTFTVDTVAPVVTVDSGPQGAVSSQAANIAFSVDDSAATVECRLDSSDAGDWALCSSPKELTGLAEGVHTLELRATDAAGNVGTVSRTWTVDTVAPAASIDSTPVADVNDSKVHSIRATFEFSADEAGSTFECRLDSTEAADWAACDSPKSYNQLADGTHNFDVRATDAAGNVGSVVSHGWEILTVKPNATITGGPSGLVNIAGASFEFTSDLGSATFECRIDAVGASNWAACPSPVNVSGLTEGDHTFELRATDLDQGTGPVVTRDWTVDTVAPVVTVDSGPQGTVASPDANIAFTVDDQAATVECRLDSSDAGDWATCASPKELTGLADGVHTLELRATDAAGNAGNVSRTWTVDTIAPEATIDVTPTADGDGMVHSIRAAFEFSATDQTAVTFECRLDSTEAADWAACDSPKSYNQLADGSHSFEIRATDAAGNVGSIVSHSWEILTDKPVVTISNGPSDPTADDSAGFDLAVDPVSGVDYSQATFECRLDSTEENAWAACASPVTFDQLTDGQHNLQVRAIDPDQGTGPSSAVTWQVDTTDPTVELTGTPAPISGTADPEFTFLVDDATATTAECRLDSSDENDWVPCSSPVSYTGLSETEHTFQVRVTDAVGHVSTPASYTWIVETTPPEATITSDQPESPTTFIKQTFGFESTNQNAYFECRFDGSAWSTCTSPVAYGQLSDAQHTFEVRAVGHGAGPGPVAAQTWTVDTVVPTLSLTSGPAAVANQTEATLEFGMNKPGYTFRCTLDGGTPEACGSPQLYTGLAAGSHDFLVEALDSGNQVVDSATRNWMILADPPVAAITEAPPVLSGSATASFRFGSDVPEATFQCRIDSTDAGDWKTCNSPAAFTGLAEGNHKVEIRATLPDGPAGPIFQHAWQVDTTAPDVRISGGPNGTVTVDSATFTVTSDDPDATTECRLDDGPWAACDGEVTLNGLANGDHQLRARSVDTAGNTGTGNRNWSVDRSLPVTTITEAPDASTTVRTATLDFAANKAGVTFECRFDDGQWQGCSPVVTYTELELGAHSFEVRATDRHGNAGDSVSHGWTVVRLPFKGLKPTVKIARKVKLNRDGDGVLARFNCPEGSCRITAPKRVTVRLKGRTVRPGLKVVRTAFDGKTTANLVSSPAIRKLIAKLGPGRTRVRFTVRSENGKSSTATVTVKLTAR